MNRDEAQFHKPLHENHDDLRPTQLFQQDPLGAMGHMASGIAHDINNALSPVALYAESLLECESGLSPRGRKYLENIRRALDDVARTVARMGDLRRESFDGDAGMALSDARKVAATTKGVANDSPMILPADSDDGLVAEGHLSPHIDQGLQNPSTTDDLCTALVHRRQASPD